MNSQLTVGGAGWRQRTRMAGLSLGVVVAVAVAASISVAQRNSDAAVRSTAPAAVTDTHHTLPAAGIPLGASPHTMVYITDSAEGAASLRRWTYELGELAAAVSQPRDQTVVVLNPTDPVANWSLTFLGGLPGSRVYDLRQP
jgi:hypothetical protein